MSEHYATATPYVTTEDNNRDTVLNIQKKFKSLFENKYSSSALKLSALFELIEQLKSKNTRLIMLNDRKICVIIYDRFDELIDTKFNNPLYETNSILQKSLDDMFIVLDNINLRHEITQDDNSANVDAVYANDDADANDDDAVNTYINANAHANANANSHANAHANADANAHANDAVEDSDYTDDDDDDDMPPLMTTS